MRTITFPKEVPVMDVARVLMRRWGDDVVWLEYNDETKTQRVDMRKTQVQPDGKWAKSGPEYSFIAHMKRKQGAYGTHGASDKYKFPEDRCDEKVVEALVKLVHEN